MTAAGDAADSLQTSYVRAFEAVQLAEQQLHEVSMHLARVAHLGIAILPLVDRALALNAQLEAMRAELVALGRQHPHHP